MKYSKFYLVSLIFISSLFVGVFVPTSIARAETGIDSNQEVISLTSLDLTFNPEAPSYGKAEHWAVIVGISDYKAINDLNFCDEDANDWYNYFVGLGYEHIIVLGDHSNEFCQFDYIASEYNIKQALNYVVANADEDDVISYVTSGHGSRAKVGESLICAWDYGDGENGEDGRFWDYELADILELAVAKQIFVFIDHCFSGGFGPELMAMSNSEYVWFGAACAEQGMGWDAPEFKNGLWTYYFLEFTLVDHFNSNSKTTMEEAFVYALAYFSYEFGVMVPQEYDGNLNKLFLLI
jgi:hypothetical protein